MAKTNRLWHEKTAQEALRETESRETGLTSAEAACRLEANGANKLEEGKKRSVFSILLAQFKDFMIWVLILAAAISAFAGEGLDAAIIAVVVLLNAVLGTVQEAKAEAALEALKEMAAPYAKALRDGALVKIPAAELVVGDVVALEAGDSVPADLRLLEAASLKIEESALTGESVPVEKDASFCAPAAAAIGDRINLAFTGSAVTYGRGKGVVVEAAMNTEMGKIAAQLASAKQERTPLQEKLNKLSNTLSYLVIGIAVLMFGIGMLGGSEPLDMFLTAVSLAVAAIPEGMVAVVTIVLALGMQRMAGRGAIIRRLPAVETLGSTGVICSDKTGTLTLNKMTVKAEYTGTAGRETLHQAMLHCNDAVLSGAGFLGDPTETALLDYVVLEKTATRQEVEARQRAGEIPFDSERKLSTVVLEQESGLRVLVKGAPDVLFLRCTHILTAQGAVPLTQTQVLEEENEVMARKALRVLAFAYKDVDSVDTGDVEGTESGLTFCGMVGMIDPPRDEARQAIATCRAAGILPVMITGDHKITAAAIAQDLGILADGRRVVTGAELEQLDDEALYAQIGDIGVFARVAPEHKSRIVAAWQRRGMVVSMTGDGVNDAPALKAADIGVAMGITGTDVAKGAADMVLTDDNFATIVVAVKEGRRIFDNIHKAVRFLLSSNCGEVITMLAATMVGWSILKAPHILWINLVTDSLPAIALGVEPEEDGVMERKPRGKEVPFFTGREWLRVGLTGLFEAALTLSAFLLGSRESAALGTTMAFLTLSLLQLFAALGFQSEHTSVFRMRAREHPVLWLALGGALLLQVVVVLVPPLRGVFGLVLPSAVNWLEITGLCIAMLLFTEAQKWLARRRGE